MTKSELRREIKAVKRNLDEDYISRNSRLVYEKLVTLPEHPCFVGLYLIDSLRQGNV